MEISFTAFVVALTSTEWHAVIVAMVGFMKAVLTSQRKSLKMKKSPDCREC